MKVLFKVLLALYYNSVVFRKLDHFSEIIILTLDIQRILCMLLVIITIEQIMITKIMLMHVFVYIRGLA